MQTAPLPTREEGRSSRGHAALGSRIGQYEIIRPLGQGGMGEVHLARDLRLGRLVAIKLLIAQRSDLDERVRDRLSRAVVGCYPRRWKQRYAAELLDVLDQHRAGPRTVLSLAGGALSTHLDPDYRMQIRLKPPHPTVQRLQSSLCRAPAP